MRVKIAVVSGAVANKLRQGGAVWTRLNWALGLRKLGFEVFFIEQIDRQTCVDRAGARSSFRDSENLKYFKTVMRQWGFGEKAALIFEDGEDVDGLTAGELRDVARDADLLINITGHLALDHLKSQIRCKVYLDLDPGFTQFWQSSGQLGSRFNGHDHYFTIGENIGLPSCPIPTGGVNWKPTRQPVVLEEWPCMPAGTSDRFTTIAAWRGPYGAVHSEGQRLGLKVHEFRKFMDLPQKVGASFELALSIHSEDAGDRKALETHGWRLVDPDQRVPDPASFRRYVQESGAEFSVAKEIYVHTNSGWFSDRTVRYLASGKPALVQETGFAERYPVGEGLVSFRTLDEAADGASRILAGYAAHSEAARRIAEAYFDSDRVLGKLTETVGVSA